MYREAMYPSWYVQGSYVPLLVYTWYTPYYTLGIPTILPHWVHEQQRGASGCVPGREALGSRLRLI